MNLNNRFVEHLNEKIGVSPKANYLLAVSGGVDSMVMLNLFFEAKVHFSVAHCNFSLRDQESDLDHQLVMEYCKQLGIPFFDITFDTKKRVAEKQLSIQETARNLRYDWFQQLLIKHNFDYIATAHHQDDNAETVLFNMIRGTGIKGLKGIPHRNKNIIRPLLFANKEELVTYASNNHIPYRNDSSNLKNSYARNKIRNSVFPLMKEVNNEVVKHINNLSEHSYAIVSIIEKYFDELSSKIIHQKNNQTIIECQTLLQDPYLGFYLYEMLSGYGFNTNQLKDIQLSLATSKTGTKFLSPTHVAVVNRSEIIIQLYASHSPSNIRLEKLAYQEFTIGFVLYSASIHTMEAINKYETNTLYLDSDLVTFPLTIRKWEPGDFFSPYGMKGKKKLSDFLIDKKVSMPDKENTFVVLSNNKILAVLNHEIDDAFKTTSQSKNILTFSWAQKKRS